MTTADAIAELHRALYGYRVSKRMAHTVKLAPAMWRRAVTRDRAWVRRAIGELRAARATHYGSGDAIQLSRAEAGVLRDMIQYVDNPMPGSREDETVVDRLSHRPTARLAELGLIVKVGREHGYDVFRLTAKARLSSIVIAQEST